MTAASKSAIDDTLGARLRRVRAAARLSHAGFGERLGVHKNTVIRYESDARAAPADYLTALCREFRVDPAWLLLGRGKMRGAGGGYSPELIRSVVRSIDEYLERERLTLAPDKKAELVVVLCEMIDADEAVDPAAPIDLARYRGVIRLAR